MKDSYYSFSIFEDRFDETKKVIRCFPSLRFIEEPQRENGFYRIKVSGTISDIHQLTGYLVNLEELAVKLESEPLSGRAN